MEKNGYDGESATKIPRSEIKAVCSAEQKKTWKKPLLHSFSSKHL
jgi:hypothetical protein